ncbi:MAG: ATP-dependent helicase [Lentisphaerae bacterium]|nr:ATP-dependent helicase [Lentisphaerota bacterium]
MDLRKALNAEQAAAVTAPDGPVLVLAAAGTGKTRTLVYRVVHLVQRGVDASRILLLTFTNKAAREMLERARALVGDRVGGLWGGTFHHMANRILRRHAEAAGYTSEFAILDRDDSLRLIAACVRELRLNDKEFPRREVLMSLFSTAANTETPLAELLERRFRDDAAPDEDILRVQALYTRRKRKQNAMDFDDLLVNCLRLLRKERAVADRYRERFQHVLVDEYQDTNRIQADIVDCLAGGHRNLLVVGDDFQSIYAWRGANYRNILGFTTRYPDAAVYKLETNYRSVPEILHVANACIAGNPEQAQKVLRPTRDGLERPLVARVRDGRAQARYVIEQVHRLCRDGYRRADIAVLYRAHFHAMELQMMLTQERLPFVITSGARFFEQAHVKDVCSLVRIMENPRDGMAFTRLLCLFPGVGERTAEKLWRALDGVFDGRSADAREQVRRALRPAARAAWAPVAAVMAAYEQDGLAEDAGETIHRFVDGFYARRARDTFDNADARLDDIRELILFTSRFERADAFLSEVALLTNLDAEDEQARDDGDALRLSTIHQAKGLEWPAVILLWATEGMFPSPRALQDGEGGEAEERRLFYVTVTRAKDALFVCAPETRRGRDGQVTYCRPSRFVNELPAGLTREVRPVLV